MTITPLPSAPARTDAPAVFIAKADAFLGALPGFVTEANVYGASLAAASAPGGISIPYTFSTTTADADPTPGFLRLGSATQNASVVIRVDLIDAMASDQTAVLDQLTASTNPIKGQLRLYKVGDASKWLVFNVTAVASPSGYRNITVAAVASSTANPFANGDAVVLSFTRAGDVGPSPTWVLLSTNTIGGAPTTITFSSISTVYSDLAFEFDNVAPSASLAPSIALSPDGTTYSAAQQLIGAAQTSFHGVVEVLGYRRGLSRISTALTGTAMTSPEIGVGLIGTSSSWAAQPFRVTGGVSAVRFSLSGPGSYSTGAVRMYGK